MEDPKKFRIKNFKFLDDFVIEILFEDGTKNVIDFGKLELKGWWKELEDINYFNLVRISEIKHLEWPNGQDFKPEHIYYWEKYEKYYLPKSENF